MREFGDVRYASLPSHERRELVRWAAEAVSRLEREQLSCVDRVLPSLCAALDVAE